MKAIDRDITLYSYEELLTMKRRHENGKYSSPAPFTLGEILYELQQRNKP